MKKTLLLLVVLTAFAGLANAKSVKIKSPDKKLSLELTEGQAVVKYKKQTVLEIPALGISTSKRGGKLTFQKNTGQQRLNVDYTMLAGKTLHPHNQATECSCDYLDPQGNTVRVVFRLFNDGLAFRYELSGLNQETLKEEMTTYRIPDGKKRWIQPWTEPYESFFPLATDGKGKSNRWGYPALIESSQNVFTLISESNIERKQSASCLYSEGENYRVTPDKNESSLSGSWHTPWRVAIIGSMADVVASTLITDVAEPSRIAVTSWIKPGVVSWIYWANNHGSNDYNIIKQYVDMASVLRLPYVLIDAEWDEMKDGKNIEDALKYANGIGVKPMIWYNSSVGWVNGAPGPKYRLNKPEDREKEFAWCEKNGIAGVKIDFFSGDNQMNMDYYIDLMESAARHHLLVNFHGATIPRGWQRTYPNLLTTEAVYGAEWYNNVPTFTNKAAAHNATLPFTRNVIGPMDYTPCAFSDSQHPHITTHAHELALTVLYESGLQHLADRPESFLAQPADVQRFLGELPVVWDETRLLAGYPAEYVVMARRSGDTWYIAAINGTDQTKSVPLALKNIAKKESVAWMFADSGNKENPWSITRSDAKSLPQEVSLQPRGGLVLVLREKHESLPLVYNEENTGSAYPKPDMPGVDQLPVIRELPDPLKGVNSFADWERKRNEVGAQIQHYGIGTKPAVSRENVSARMDGDTLFVDVTVNGETLHLRGEIRYPKVGEAPYALMIGASMNALPAQLFKDRPIATMNFRESQVNDYTQMGMRKRHERGEHDFDRLYPDLYENGAYSEWAWGFSRLIDGLQILGPEVTKIDTRRIGVTGCSYAGKMALYCGAFDERVALTIAQEPGGGGAAAWRASHLLDEVESLERTDYHWFKESMRDNFSGDSVYRLPYDQHQLCAMVCPRALLLLGNSDYQWLADPAMLVSAKAAAKVWQRFGIADRMSWSVIGGHPHCRLPEVQFALVEDYLDRFLVAPAKEE